MKKQKIKKQKNSGLRLVSDFDFISFLNSIRDCQVILFGAASSGKRVLLSLLEKGIKKDNLLFYDNNSDKWGKKIIGVRVMSLDDFRRIKKDTPILISSCMFEEITSQLKYLSFTDFYYVRDLLYKNQIFLKYDNRFLKILDDVSERCNMDNEEKFTLYSSMKAVKHLDGDVVEVGVYKGGSAKILCEAKGNKAIHLFDTFEGLPEKVIAEEDLVRGGWLSDVSKDDVERYLNDYSNVYFYKGLFPQTASWLKSKKFCLVHLDTDIYQGTIEGLKFFWPRMTKGGRIISHDYNNVDCPGVKRAF